MLERIGLRLGWVPRLVEASEIRVVIGDPLFDRLPGWLDGLHCFDVEGRRWRAGEMDDAFHSSLKLRTARPEAVEAEEEFDSARNLLFGWGPWGRC